jgi:SAM-dependent methyltransferase
MFPIEELDRPATQCPVCRGPMALMGTADYYMPGAPRTRTAVSRCPGCGAIARGISEGVVVTHCGVATYVDPRSEEGYYNRRITFFAYLYDFATKAAGTAPKRCLDFGCSFGHFLRLMADRGCEVAGIEQDQRARTLCRGRGMTVYGSAQEMLDNPANRGAFDLVTAVDSLYYVTDPVLLVKQLGSLLADQGVLLLRVCNRNWILRLMHRFGRKHYGYWLGDATVGYSKKSLRVLLSQAGLSVVRWGYWEGGKVLPTKLHLYYWGISAVTLLTFGTIPLSPGIIVVAKKTKVGRMLSND